MNQRTFVERVLQRLSELYTNDGLAAQESLVVTREELARILVETFEEARQG